MKVTVLGAAGGIGQALALLLKLHLPAGSSLALYDIAPVTPGVAVDLSHIPSDVEVHGYSESGLAQALDGSNVVVILAGVARKPGMTRADLFNINASIVRDLVAKVAEHCPEACVCIVTNPVNALVPMAAEVLKKAGVYDENKLFGVTTLDVIRAESFVGEIKNLDATSVRVPVVGGHSSPTIIPLLSQAAANGVALHFTDDQIAQLTARIKDAGTEVVEAKVGNGSATLSMAEAAARLVYSLLKGLSGKENIVYTYVSNNEDGLTSFFARPVRLGKMGIVERLPLGKLSDYEQSLLQTAVEKLTGEIQQGVDFVA